MRVLAIAQLGHAATVDAEHIGEQLLLVGKGEPLADHAVVSRGRAERLGGHALAEGEGRRTVVRAQFGQQVAVIGRIGHYGHVGVVLRRRPDHARTADVDVLDDLVACRAAGHGFLERVEVDHDQVDRTDLVRFHRGGVIGIVAHRQQPAVDHRVQGLHAAVHHLGKAGEFRHVAHRQPGVAQCLGRAAGRHEFDARIGEGRAERNKAFLVGHRKQRPLDRHVGHGWSIPFS